MPKGLRQVALSISRLSPMVRWPDALLATKMASLIFLPERRFFAFTSFQSLSWPSLRLENASDLAISDCSARLLDIFRGEEPVVSGETPRLAISQQTNPLS